MAGRDMRGASYMDQYDSQYDAGGSYDTSKKSDGLGGCARCSKHMLFIVNFVMMLIGIALIVVVFFMKENAGEDNEDIPFELNETVVWLSAVTGGFIIIVSFLGCLGATMKSKCILTMYTSLLILCLVLGLVGIGIIYFDESLLEDTAKASWDSWSEDLQTAWELDNNCSGFDGCYGSIRDRIENNLFVVGGVIIGVFVYQLIMAIFSCCLCMRVGKGNVSIDDV